MVNPAPIRAEVAMAFRLVAMLVVMLAGAGFIPPSQAGPPKDGVQPRLIVLISIDQFSTDLFNGYRDQFRGGLKTLAHGIVYANAFHAHGITETCAGHAVIATGRHPNATGIVANQWFDQKDSVDRYCTDDGVHVAAHASRKSGTGPGLLEVATLGDWLKAASPASRVYSVAGKDRSAIMMGGHQPDGAFWFDGKQGFDSWGTSVEAARRQLRPLEKVNEAVSRRIAGREIRWLYHRKACRTLEASFPLDGGGVFHAHLPPDPPAPVPGRPEASGPALPPWFYDSVTIDAALSLIETERLGRASATDLLAVGLSGTDMVGHAYGTQGPEMCDHLVRLDEGIGRLLRRLEALRIPVAVAVTADHGGSDIPERLKRRGYTGAGRIDAADLLGTLNVAVRGAVGVDWNALKPAFFDPTQLVIVDAGGKALGDAALKQRIADAAARYALGHPGIAGAWTGNQLQGCKPDPRLPPDQLSFADRMALSFYAQRSGDVLLATDPLKVPAPPFPGLFMTGHSGPSDFNRRVPILLWRPGIAHQERALPISVVDLAPTLAALAGVSPSGDVDGRCIDIAEFGVRCEPERKTDAVGEGDGR